MNGVQRAMNRVGGWFLVRSGRGGRLTTTGRRSGAARTVAIEFAERPAGGFYVGAGHPGRAWVANLGANPACTFTVRGTAYRCRAERLDGQARVDGTAALSARLGTRAGQATWVEVFALVPSDGAAATPGQSTQPPDDAPPTTPPTA